MYRHGEAFMIKEMPSGCITDTEYAIHYFFINPSVDSLLSHMS